MELKPFEPGEKLKVALLSRTAGLLLELSTYESEEEVVKKLLPGHEATLIGVNDAGGEVHHYFRVNVKDLDMFSLVIASDKPRQVMIPKPAGRIALR